MTHLFLTPHPDPTPPPNHPPALARKSLFFNNLKNIIILNRMMFKVQVQY